MKLTDLALVFMGITLPIMIVIYVNVSYTIKAGEQEMYYQKLMDVATQDAANKMKQVENEDLEIDYGYSGLRDKKVSINAQVAVDTFLNSLYNNFGIKGNRSAESYFQIFVPAIAVLDYNGVQVSSIEKYTGNSGDNLMSHKVKPKRYYTYTYCISKLPGGKYTITYDPTATDVEEIHTIEFTMDDYITHRGTKVEAGKNVEYNVKSFFVTDNANNEDLGPMSIRDDVVTMLVNKRPEIIVNTIVNEMSFAVNSNNSYARAAGITYNFSFPATTTTDMYTAIESIGIMAFAQGIPLGNKYLNSKSYGITKLELANRFHLSTPNADSKYKMNLYHKDVECPEYLVSIQNIEKISPEYTMTKQHAASVVAMVTKKGEKEQHTAKGFYPCTICNP